MVHEDPVLSLAFTRDGTLLASGAQDGKIKVWRIATGQVCVPDAVRGRRAFARARMRAADGMQRRGIYSDIASPKFASLNLPSIAVGPVQQIVLSVVN